MKKRVLTLMMALVMILGLVGCGGGGKNPAGTYSLTKMSFGEEEMDVEGLGALFEVEIDVTLELKEDKSFVLDFGVLQDGETTSGTWKLDGTSLVLTAEGEEQACSYDGKTIVLDVEGEKMTFEKQ